MFYYSTLVLAVFLRCCRYTDFFLSLYPWGLTTEDIVIPFMLHFYVLEAGYF